MSDGSIVLANVTKSYTRAGSEIKVLQDLNLEIGSGDFVALMGPSGSGKTTILNLLAGIDRPTHGTIKIDGASLTTLSESQLSDWRATHIGLIFQFYNLLAVLSAERNVEVPLLLTNLSRAERRRRVGVALDLVGLSQFARSYPSQLSGGQAQRVAIARAVVADPKILLCDEPTGDLDRQTADEVLGLLRTLNTKFNKTIVMVTHDPQASEFAKRVLHLDKGRLK